MLPVIYAASMTLVNHYFAIFAKFSKPPISFSESGAFKHDQTTVFPECLAVARLGSAVPQDRHTLVQKPWPGRTLNGGEEAPLKQWWSRLHDPLPDGGHSPECRANP